MNNSEYSLKELYDVVIKATYPLEINGKTILENETIAAFDKIQVANFKEAVEVNEIMLVIDSMIGQDSVNVAKSFNDILEIDGVILTKLDGDTRGGVALSVRSVIGKPIKFCSVGEKLTDLEPFYPDRMASRILGMGDVMSLIEKAQEAVSEEDIKQMEKGKDVICINVAIGQKESTVNSVVETLKKHNFNFNSISVNLHSLCA